MTQDERTERCSTLGCDNSPSEDRYCHECIDTSPKLVDEPDTLGETVNPAGGVAELTDSPGSPRESVEEAYHHEANPAIETGGPGSSDRWRSCFIDAIDWFHAQLDRKIADHTESGEHPDRPATARAYFRGERGWSDDTIDYARLGYAPASEGALLDHLMQEGYDRKAILGTGLFTESLRPLWQGRYVLPYLDTDGEPTYAISRATGHEGGGAGGYDGHPVDRMSGKYAKPAHTKPYAHVEEPIFGLGSVEDGEPVLITEGIADAITAHQAGYPCLSPVTTRFKHGDRERLAESLDAHDVPRAYVIGDAERPGSDLDDEDRLTLSQLGEGIDGALDTAAHLADDGVDARVVELPHPGLDKVDLDDYLHEWVTDGDLGEVLASAKPAEQHPGYDPGERAMRAAATGRDYERERGSSGEHSALFDLDIRDITGRAWGSRGVNPLGHHGESKNYYVLVKDHAVGYDHKYKVAYNALTHLLVESGERRAASPNGRLDDSEVFAAWRQAKDDHLIPDDDPIPQRALRHVALSNGLCAAEAAEEGWKLPREAYNGAIELIKERYDVESGRDPLFVGGGGREYPVGTCKPPLYDTVGYEREERWDEIANERVPQWLDDGQPLRIFADNAGAGKTTSTIKGLYERDEPTVAYFDKHAKAAEFIDDDATPDDFFHLKGGEQPEHQCCMMAKLQADEGGTPECLNHGHPSNWPRMSNIYDFDRESEKRQQYERLVGALTPQQALRVLDEDGDLLDDNAWLESLEQVQHEDYVAAVHPYQTLKTVRKDRANVVDETPQIQADEDSVSYEDLGRLAKRLERLSGIAEDNKRSHNFEALAGFVEEAADRLIGSEHLDLATLEVPEFRWEKRFNLKDPMSGHGIEEIDIAESLAQLKLTYNEGLVTLIRTGKDNGEPFGIDTVLGMLAEASHDTHVERDIRRAIATPQTLRSCPWCGGHVEAHNGARACVSDDCDWSEEYDAVTDGIDEPARIVTWAEDKAVRNHDGETTAWVKSRNIPPTDELPSPLVLDATATPAKVGAFYGVDVQEVDVVGDEPLDLTDKVHTTQIADGQYHAGTLEESDHARESIQESIDRACELHEKPLIVLKSSLKRLFDFPDNALVKKFHATRGLNYNDCGAVMVVGAPHPHVNDVGRDAALLAMDRPQTDVGGIEHSTRRDAPNPPIYTKLLYEDANGDGLAVPTKHYSGMVGDLFYEAREKEINQIFHRIRPLLVDEGEAMKNAYLLTNVPTDLPIDEVCTFDELTGDIQALLPVSDGALRLLGYANRVMEGEQRNGFRSCALVEEQADGSIANKASGWHRLARLFDEDVTERTVRNWIGELEAVGLLTPGSYEQRRGVSYTADESTLKRALQVVSSSAGFEVAAFRRFCHRAAHSNGSLDWLTWAERVLSLAGSDPDRDFPPPLPS